MVSKLLIETRTIEIKCTDVPWCLFIYVTYFESAFFNLIIFVLINIYETPNHHMHK